MTASSSKNNVMSDVASDWGDKCGGGVSTAPHSIGWILVGTIAMICSSDPIWTIPCRSQTDGNRQLQTHRVRHGMSVACTPYTGEQTLNPAARGEVKSTYSVHLKWPL